MRSVQIEFYNPLGSDYEAFNQKYLSANKVRRRRTYAHTRTSILRIFSLALIFHFYLSFEQHHPRAAKWESENRNNWVCMILFWCLIYAKFETRQKMADCMLWIRGTRWLTEKWKTRLQIAHFISELGWHVSWIWKLAIPPAKKCHHHHHHHHDFVYFFHKFSAIHV